MIQPEEKYVMPEVQPEVPINDQITASHTVTEAQPVYQTQTHTEPMPQVVYQPEATDITQPTAVQAPSHTTSNVVEPPIHTTDIQNHQLCAAALVAERAYRISFLQKEKPSQCVNLWY